MSEPLNLGDSVIGAATAAAGEVITSSSDQNSSAIAYLKGLGEIVSATLSINFTAGNGDGSTVKVLIETSIDQGTSWQEVWRAAFTTSSARKMANLSALTPVSPYTPTALSDDAVKDGVVGDRWRARKITTGTYTGNASVSVRMQPHG